MQLTEHQKAMTRGMTEYAGDCKHNAARGNKWYGCWCPDCGCRDMGTDKWWQDETTRADLEEIA